MIRQKLANVLLEPNASSSQYPALYCRAEYPLARTANGEWCITQAGYYDFTTYFNALSIKKWREYSKIREVQLHLELKGSPCKVHATSARPFTQVAVKGDVLCALDGPDDVLCGDVVLPEGPHDVLVSFAIEATGPLVIGDCYYFTEVHEADLNPIELALATTTFKKEDYILPNIQLIRDEILASGDELSQHFTMHVIDNASSLDAESLSGGGVVIHPNSNVGGSGGFARGMIEALEQSPPATNVVLMDDDVVISPESIRRTYFLLRLLKAEYEGAMISGAMLLLEEGDMQWEDIGYMTAAGRFSGVKEPMKVSTLFNVVRSETIVVDESIRDRVYAAWWYCCIPTEVIRQNGMPLPFFVRCDDAEYGIRCGAPYISMNGICIWHMGFHQRYNAAVERYQTTRNTMIAQAVTGMAQESDFLLELEHNLFLELKKFNYTNARLLLDGFEDFLKGPEYIMQPVAEEAFMRANRVKEQMLDFDDLQKVLDEEGIGLDLSEMTQDDIIEFNPYRTTMQRAYDFITCNGQRTVFAGNPQGFAAIPAAGWIYPAMKIHKRDTLLAIDAFTEKGVLRKRDKGQYKEIVARYKRDLKQYKRTISDLRIRYAAKRGEMTSIGYWKQYLAEYARSGRSC